MGHYWAMDIHKLFWYYYGAVLPRRRPHHVLILSVCLSVPCLHLEGKRKGLRIPNLVGRVPGTRAPHGPISRSRGQRSRSRRLIALLAKNPHNLPPVVRSTSYLAGVIRTPHRLAPGDLVTMATAVPSVWKPRKPQNSTHVQQHAVLNCKDGPIAGGPSTAAPTCFMHDDVVDRPYGKYCECRKWLWL